MPEVLQSLSRFLPELVVTGALLLVVLVDAAGIPGRNAVVRVLTVGGLLAALVLAARQDDAPGYIFSGMLAVDPMSVFFKALLVAASLAIALVFTFRNSRELSGLGQGEFYALLLAVTLSNVLTLFPYTTLFRSRKSVV